MTEVQWNAFLEYRESLRDFCKKNTLYSDELKRLQMEAREKETGKQIDYSLDCPLVYNKAYDDFTKDDSIKLIVIGDNPGKSEQLFENQKYLVGQSGKIACNFFKNHPELNIDFRKNVIIANKTPIHTAKTNQLKFLMQHGSSGLVSFIIESQIFMADITSKLHQNLIKGCENINEIPELWLIGYSELKKKGIFEDYRRRLVENYRAKENDWDFVRVFRHFSMNSFSNEFNAFSAENLSMSSFEKLKFLGLKHRKEIFGDLTGE